MEKILWSPHLWVGRRRELILGCISRKEDKDHSRLKRVKNMKIWVFLQPLAVFFMWVMHCKSWFKMREVDGYSRQTMGALICCFSKSEKITQSNTIKHRDEINKIDDIKLWEITILKSKWNMGCNFRRFCVN